MTGVLKHETTDLRRTLEFVTRRIAEEGTRTGEPLTDHQRLLLAHLPTEPIYPGAYSSDPDGSQLITPRNLDYEKLCALAKAAHQNDLHGHPGDQMWMFARAVTQLHKHPMSWLLDWAEVKLQRPWWDKFLLVALALIAIILGMTLMFVALETNMRFSWPVSIAGGAALFVVIGIGVRSSERSQLNRLIEKYRKS